MTSRRRGAGGGRGFGPRRACADQTEGREVGLLAVLASAGGPRPGLRSPLCPQFFTGGPAACRGFRARRRSLQRCVRTRQEHAGLCCEAVLALPLRAALLLSCPPTVGDLCPPRAPPGSDPAGRGGTSPAQRGRRLFVGKAGRGAPTQPPWPTCTVTPGAARPCLCVPCRGPRGRSLPTQSAPWQPRRPCRHCPLWDHWFSRSWFSNQNTTARPPNTKPPQLS